MYNHNKKPDVFICHSSKDKNLIAKPLADHLISLGLNVWYDEYSILVGKSVNEEIHRGVKNALLGVPIFSRSFFNSDWTMLELGKLHSKMIENPDSIFPLYWGITNQEIAIRLPFLADPLARDVTQQNLKSIAVEIFERVDEGKAKRKKRTMLISSFTLIILTVIYFLISQFPINDESIQAVTTPVINKPPIPNDTVIPAVFIPTQTPRLKNETSGEVYKVPQKQPLADTEDYSTYVNSQSRVDMSVFILDAYGNIEPSLSSSVAKIYSKEGKKTGTGLLRSTFFKKPEFQELLQGNSDIIEKLGLNTYTDFMALGKISYSLRPGKLVDGTIVCSASITMSIISTFDKSISQSFTISANGNGVTESQAQEYALQNLLYKYKDEHSFL